MLIHYTPMNEWQDLLEQLASCCSTTEAKTKSKNIKPSLNRQEIEGLWSQILPLQKLANLGYEVHVGDIQPVKSILDASQKEQILTGEDLRCIFDLLETTHRVHKFSHDFSHKCSTLASFEKSLNSIPELRKIIDQCIQRDGTVKDDATQNLLEIRQKKISLRKRIEEKIQSMFQREEHRTYIQDEYFTIRSDRYVVPIKLDGRGRVAGSIIDTSTSGQTLFIEPEQIRRQNESIQEIELAEKLEIIQIFKSISERVRAESNPIENNYDALIRLDLLSARSRFAKELEASPVQISETPIIDLISARHPLVRRENSQRAIANNIGLNKQHKTMIISGPNAGGKTIVLKTVGMLQAMLKSGFLIPAEPSSKMYIFENVFFIMGDSQNIEQKLSTFSGHIKSIKSILTKSRSKDLVLLDELASGTEPETGAAMAQAVLESLQKKKILTLATTHFERLKTLAIHNPEFRNASMQYSEKTGKPSFKILHDIAGQSLGLETASREGLPESIIKRAEEIRGGKFSSLEKALEKLSIAEASALSKAKTLDQQILKSKIQEEHWQKERENLQKTRKDAAINITDHYEKIFSSMREELKMDLKKLKDMSKKSTVGNEEEIQKIKTQDRDRKKQFEKTVNSLDQIHQNRQELPGKAVQYGDLKKGDQVYIIGLGKNGEITKVATSTTEPYTVDFGLLQIRANLSQIRLLPKAKAKPKSENSPKIAYSKKQQKSSIPTSPIKTSLNSLDLRGCSVEDALEKMWKFVDTAIVRGEKALFIIHGIGSNTLRQAIHESLKTNTNYELSFKPANRENGSTGTTMIYLK